MESESEINEKYKEIDSTVEVKKVLREWRKKCDMKL
jgi:hypothetical protein